MRIFEAVEAPFGEDVPEQFRNSALEYELRLYTGRVARAVVYLVYAEPLRESAPGVKRWACTTAKVTVGFLSCAKGALKGARDRF